MRFVHMYDTTLRDGNQAMAISLSLADKLAITKKLDTLGVSYIEGGWPNPTNPTDVEFYPEVRKLKLKAKIAAFGSTRRSGVRAKDDPIIKSLVKTKAGVITIFGKSWDLHVTEVIRTSLKENLAMIEDSVAYLKKHCAEVVYDAEHFFDGYRANQEYALETLRAAQRGGADVIVLCDTNGGMLPLRFQEIFLQVKEALNHPLGAHCHNDSGCAAANSVVAAELGAVQIQGVMNGFGERCGNANLATVIPNLELKSGIQCIRAGQLKNLKEVSVYVSEIANMTHDERQPYVGEAAFSHKGGAHIDGVVKVKHSFEHVPPESVGNQRHYLLSDQSGGSTIVQKLAPLVKIDKKDPLVAKLLHDVKRMEHDGYQFEAAEGSFELLARRDLNQFKVPFIFRGFRVIEEKREDGTVYSEATIKVEAGGHVEHTAAEGNGPVSALDNAIRKALTRFFPQLAEVRLVDFKVRVLDGRSGTLARVRVWIRSTDGKDYWGTVGVSANIIEAAWIALIDAINFKLMKSVVKRK